MEGSNLSKSETLLHKKVFLTCADEDEIELFSIGNTSVQKNDLQDALLVTNKRIYHANKSLSDYVYVETIDISDVIKVEYRIPKRKRSFWSHVLFLLVSLLFLPFILLYLLYIMLKRKNVFSTIEYTSGKMSVNLKHRDYGIFVEMRNVIFSAKDNLKQNTPFTPTTLPPRPQNK